MFRSAIGTATTVLDIPGPKQCSILVSLELCSRPLLTLVQVGEMKPQAPVIIKLNSAQRALILEASGKEVAALQVEALESGSGWLYAAAGGKEAWLLKPPDPKSYLAAKRNHRPKIEPRYAHCPLRIGRSRIHRVGVFAVARIPARRMVIEYTGEHVNPVEAYRRTKHEKETYVFNIDKFWRVDAVVGGSGAEFINHSCDPNLKSRLVAGCMMFRSLRPIAGGEELTVDYHFSHTAPKVPCHCRSPKCRGTINVVKTTKSKRTKTAAVRR